MCGLKRLCEVWVCSVSYLGLPSPSWGSGFPKLETLGHVVAFCGAGFWAKESPVGFRVSERVCHVVCVCVVRGLNREVYGLSWCLQQGHRLGIIAIQGARQRH